MSVSNIDAPLVVNGGAGTNSSTSTTRLDATGDTLVLTSSRIDGLDLYSDAPAPWDGIGYSSIASLNLRLGSGGDLIRVRSTSAATTIESRGGNDTFDVSSDAPTNAGSLDLIAGALTLDGGTSTTGDVAMFSDRGDVTGDTGTLTSSTFTGFSPGVITYLELETLHIDLGSGSDNLLLDSTGAVTTVDGGDGDDVIDVETVDHVTRINGDAGDDTLTVNRQPNALPVTGNGIVAR